MSRATAARANYSNLISNTPGKLGWWKLDESTGNVADSSGNGNTGTATPAASNFTYNGTGLIYNDPIRSIACNNNTSYFNVGNPAIYDNLTAVSVEAWFVMQDQVTTRALVARGATSTSGADRGAFLLRSNNSTSGAPRFSVGTNNGVNGTEYTVQGTTVLAVGSINHVVGTWIAGGRVKIYVNGVCEAQLNTAGTQLNSSANDPVTLFNVVTNGTVGAGHRNKAQHLVIYNRVLGPGEIMDHYNVGRSFTRTAATTRATATTRPGAS